MNVLEMTVQADGPEPGTWNLHVVGDAHIDSRLTDRDRLKRHIQYIADDPHGIWIGVGDWVDGTTPQHRFADTAWIDSLHPDALLNMGHYVAYTLEVLGDILSPLKGKPGIILQGNHDVRRGITWSGLAWELARRIGCEFGGDECLIRIRAETPNATRGANVWTCYACHGSGGGLLPGGKVNRHQRDALALTMADICVRGHVHDSLCRILYLMDISRRGNPRLIRRPRAFLTAPGYMQNRMEGVNGYAAQKMYPVNDEALIGLEITNPLPRGNMGDSHGGRIRRVECPF